QVVRAAGAARHLQLPLEVATPETERLDGADKQRAVFPCGRLRKDAQKSTGDGFVFRIRARDPLQDDTAGLEHTANDPEILRRIEIAGTGIDRMNDVGRDDVVLATGQQHVISAVIDAQVNVWAGEDIVTDAAVE